jgi:lysozyme
MSQNEYDAFVSICFNIGQGGLGTSTFAERFNAGDKEGCAGAILWWDTPSEIIPRRQGEQVQFLCGYVPRITQIGP